MFVHSSVQNSFSCKMFFPQKVVSCIVQMVYVRVGKPLTDLWLCHHRGLSVTEWRERQPELSFFVPLETQELLKSKSSCLWYFWANTTHPADMHTHIFAYTLTTAHHMLTLLSTDLGFVWAPPRVRLGHKCVSFSRLFCHKQMRCGVGRQCSLERLFIGNSYPQRQKARESNHNNNSTDNGNNVD